MTNPLIPSRLAPTVSCNDAIEAGQTVDQSAFTADIRSGAGSSSAREENDSLLGLVRLRAAAKLLQAPPDDRSGSSTPDPTAGHGAGQLLSKDLANFVLYADDDLLREVLRHGLQRACDPKWAIASPKFSDLVFTQKFSAFDRQNKDAGRNMFHGFYTLFWLSLALYVLKMAFRNWLVHGNPFGTNEIVTLMFRRDVTLLFVLDGIMCGLTSLSWLIQNAVYTRYLDWNRQGWIIQHVWQTMFIAGVIGLTLLRKWPWPHTVFFVLHGLVMLMKQHSYAFYNGHLSTVLQNRASLTSKLRCLEAMKPVKPPSRTSPAPSSLSVHHLSLPPSSSLESHQSYSAAGRCSDETVNIDKIAAAITDRRPLDHEQIRLFARIIQWEIDAFSSELHGTAAAPDHIYPQNLTLINFCEYIVLPTVVYELGYPRSKTINIAYVAEKMAAMVGVIFVMILVSQTEIYPVVMKTIAMKESGMPLIRRIQIFPSILYDLVFPFMMEYLLAWYLIWETILNILAEVTFFADRSFYDAWWNSVSWDQFARDWNRPVHNFLLRHVYHSSISSMKINKHTATLITFALSACVHELVMWCIFQKLRGYLLVLQMCQLPLVKLSRTAWLRERKVLGNLIFWVGIFTCPSLLCSLYLIL